MSRTDDLESGFDGRAISGEDIDGDDCVGKDNVVAEYKGDGSSVDGNNVGITDREGWDIIMTTGVTSTLLVVWVGFDAGGGDDGMITV